MRVQDRCEQCHTGRFAAYHSRTRGSLRTTYLKCNNCGETDKQLSRVDHIGRIVAYLSTSNGIQVDSHKATQL